MDTVFLSRLQFAITSSFHFIFPPVTIGLSWIIFFLMKKWKSSEDLIWEQIVKFWFRLFAITFAVGVATGIVMEFQFGTNWSNYSRFVGDIFGAPLAAEGIFSFFMESIFIGVIIYGFGKFSKRTLYICSFLLAVGTTLSAFWIIVANSWMQTPTGYEIQGGRAVLTDFWAVLFNPSTLPRYLHTMCGAFITAALFMSAISARLILKDKDVEHAKRSLKIAVIVGFIASLAQLGLGHYHAIQVALTQPEKLATFEGLYETQKAAPAIIFGIPDEKNDRIVGAVRIPGLLSLLTHGRLDAEVKGMNDFPKELRPPLTITFTTFHLMVVLGFYFIGLTGLGVLLLITKKLWSLRPFLWLVFISVPLPFIANDLGWISSEVGRQPWAVYHVIKTSDAASLTVPAGEVLFSIILFSAIYILLFFSWIFLLRRHVSKGPGVAL